MRLPITMLVSVAVFLAVVFGPRAGFPLGLIQDKPISEAIVQLVVWFSLIGLSTTVVVLSVLGNGRLASTYAASALLILAISLPASALFFLIATSAQGEFVSREIVELIIVLSAVLLWFTCIWVGRKLLLRWFSERLNWQDTGINNVCLAVCLISPHLSAIISFSRGAA